MEGRLTQLCYLIDELARPAEGKGPGASWRHAHWAGEETVTLARDLVYSVQMRVRENYYYYYYTWSKVSQLKCLRPEVLQISDDFKILEYLHP